MLYRESFSNIQTFFDLFIQNQVFFQNEIKFQSHIYFEPSTKTFALQLKPILNTFLNSLSELSSLNIVNVPFRFEAAYFVSYQAFLNPKSSQFNDIHLSFFSLLDEFRNKISSLKEILSYDKDSFASFFDPNGEIQLQDYKLKLTKIQECYDLIDQNIYSCNIGIFKLNCDEFRKFALGHCKTLFNNLLLQVKFLFLQNLNELRKDFVSTTEHLSRIPKKPSELNELKLFAENVANSSHVRSAKLSVASRRIEFLEEYRFLLSDEECTFWYKACQYHKQIDKTMIQVERTLKGCSVGMTCDLRMCRKELETKSEEL